MNLRIKLNNMEQRMARFLGKARAANAARKNMSNMYQRSDEPNGLIHFEGAASEIAFCKAYNLYPDTEDDLDRDQLTPSDAVMPNGIGVDVKVTAYSHGHLAVDMSKNGKHADVYFLVIGKFPDYRLAGWLPKHEIVRDDMIKVLKTVPVYAAAQDQLRHPMELFSYEKAY